MKIPRLAVCFLIGTLATSTAWGAESPEDELGRLQAEVDQLQISISDPAMLQQRRILQQQMFEKIRRIHELRGQGIKPSEAVPGGVTPKPGGEAPLKRPTASKKAPSNPVASSSSRPKASPSAPSEKEDGSMSPTLDLPGVTLAAPSAKPSGIEKPVTLIAAPDPSGLSLYTAEELGLGRGTQQAFDEVARLLRAKDQDGAGREWKIYLAGEKETLADQRNRVEAIIHYIVRQAHVEIESDLALYAAQVDIAKARGDAAATAQAEAEFREKLQMKPKLVQTIRDSMSALRKVSDEVLR